MSKLKLIVIIGTIVGILILGVTVCIQNKHIDTLKTEIKISNSNYKALENESSILKEKSYTYQLSIKDLENSKDSLNIEMLSLKNQLKIKDKEIKELAYVASTASRADTVIIKDTIINKIQPIDTLIGDEWYSLNLKFISPQLIVSPKFNSEKYIFTYLRKETINPSKCKLINIFKKKESILEVEVVEKSPYIINNKERFIKILDK